MGLGGHLTWTPVAREIIIQYKIKMGNFKILPIENTTICNSPIFKNNPNFVFEKDSYPKFILNFSDIKYHYGIPENNNSIMKWVSKKHMIHYISDQFNLNNVDLKCDLFFTNNEISFCLKLIDELPKTFIAIEPSSKQSFTANKIYPYKKWQKIIDKLKNKLTFVQVGKKKSQLLDDVIDMRQNSFRECACLISYSKFFVGLEGGLMHAANSVNKRSVIVYTGWCPKEIWSYPDQKLVYVGGSHSPEGINTIYKPFYNEVQKHNEDEIIEKILEMDSET